MSPLLCSLCRLLLAVAGASDPIDFRGSLEDSRDEGGWLSLLVCASQLPLTAKGDDDDDDNCSVTLSTKFLHETPAALALAMKASRNNDEATGDDWPLMVGATASQIMLLVHESGPPIN